MKRECEDWPAERLAKTPLADLRRLRDELAADLIAIQTQLGDKNKLGEDGKLMGFVEWNQWRQKAKYALAKKQAAIARVNTAISTLSCEVMEQRVLGSIRPNARAILRELVRYEFGEPADAGVRRTFRSLAEVVFSGAELAEMVAAVERWESAGRDAG